MTDNRELIAPIFNRYYKSFVSKTYSEENDDYDILMHVFNISPERKRENRQYWGRELGMIWQLTVTALAKKHCDDFGPALKFGADEPCDLTIGRDAIDTKYRIGSGDSGTLKKLKQYGHMLHNNGYQPILLIMREDNLPAAITACHSGYWTVLTGEDAFKYLWEKTGVNVEKLLLSFENEYNIV